MWMLLRAAPRPCFNQALIERHHDAGAGGERVFARFDFWVTGSLVPNMFNVGGDLQFFAEAIKNRKREAMMAYARACIDCACGGARFRYRRGQHCDGRRQRAMAALKRRWRTISCWRRTMRAWGSRRLRSTCFRHGRLLAGGGMRLAEELIWGGESHTAEWFESQAGGSAVPARRRLHGDAHFHRYHPAEAQRHAPYRCVSACCS